MFALYFLGYRDNHYNKMVLARFISTIHIIVRQQRLQKVFNMARWLT